MSIEDIRRNVAAGREALGESQAPLRRIVEDGKNRTTAYKVALDALELVKDALSRAQGYTQSIGSDAQSAQAAIATAHDKFAQAAGDSTNPDAMATVNYSNLAQSEMRQRLGMTAGDMEQEDAAMDGIAKVAVALGGLLARTSPMPEDLQVYALPMVKSADITAQQYLDSL